MPQAVEKVGAVENHCPFGCELGDLNDHGYCKHLIGWTNDGINVEVRQKLDYPYIGERIAAEKIRFDKKIHHLVPANMSDRVYLDPTKAEKRAKE